MTREEKVNLLNELLEIEEKNDISNLTRADRREFQEWVIKALEQEPTGHWIIEDMFDGDVAYRCSECNELFWLESGTPKDNEYNFCPKCGKRLVDPHESEDKKCSR